MSNKNLIVAKSKKNDEFYTQLADIEKELQHYWHYFKGKTVLCNCDDLFESNFFKYFAANFNRLGLKKLICTSYAGSPVAGTKLQYNVNKNGQMSFVYDKNGQLACSEKHAYKAVINVVRETTGDEDITVDDVAKLFRIKGNELTELEGDGDFRSEECIKLLKEADIVCTNPPFSLFRVFLKELTEEEKVFLIVGNINEMLCKDIFPMFQDGKIRYGSGMITTFHIPDGKKKFGNVGWYTNIGTAGKTEPLQLEKKFNETDYPVYDNYPAISIDRVKNIPCDYFGTMGVPSSYLLHHDPNQFELIGTSGMLAGEERFPDGTVKKNPGRFYLNGRRLYERVVIRRKSKV